MGIFRFKKIAPALMATGVLVACSEPAAIEENCTANGRGDVSCEFSNKGEAEGSKCVNIVLKNTGYGYMEGKTNSSREICSGIVKGGDVVQRETSGGFAMSPMDFCSGSKDSWADNCELSVVSDLKDSN